ncbi:lytic transglycosylase domain-containing protein [Parabacteroides sp. PF5-9]|uniref:lytic transglycosylase domain-containing protein n=1 Tax=Parabacteroides sp. PF5-9 TaxID=1742404 RepID=UPI002476F78C|nr:lytic transglycosylase domain-containing protein [Parabacteroides sp. PF5-9]MDH6358798.1 membrane-bound lytic murein transglycosylase D [Parabacteroides sp. PF5-9]
MKKQLFILLGLCCFTLLSHAQNLVESSETEFSEEQTDEELQYSTLSEDSDITAEIGLIPESLDANVDSLLHSWHVQYFSKRDDFCHDDESNVFFPDSIYIDRLQSMPCIIPMTYNNIVRNCIDIYAERRRSLIRYMLGMADFYFPIIEQILDEHGLPHELKYLTIVESALNPTALSRVGASGIWQFMLPTGKNYGLEINSLVDERRDPVKATHAACRYFKDMYAIYEDWQLVIASYNCGPGNINKAIRRANGKTDFWDIYPYLPRETRLYVPLFIAANYIMTYHCDHNLCAVETNLPLATDTVIVNNMLHFEQIADILDINIEQLRVLNPQYQRDIVPGNTRPSILKLPVRDTYTFIDKEDTIYTHRAEELLAHLRPINSPEGNTSKTATREKITHTVLNGENLYTVANRYGVTAKDIRKWNGLRSNRVAKGRRLTLYVDNGGVSFASNTAKKTTPSTAATQKESTLEKSEGGYITYIVQSGDSLYSIARKYPGISATTIQHANNLSNSRIHPGQKLKIPAAG